MPAPNLSAFIAQAIPHMTDNGVTVHFVAKPRYSKCAGIFCFPNFHLAMKRKGWEETFVHEYAHFLQHLDEDAKIPVTYPMMRVESYNDWWDWLDGKIELDNRKLRRLRKSIQKMERDCDHRALKLIADNNLEIDVGAYAQRSNCYQLFYTLVERYRKWYVVPPYQLASVIALMPTKLMRSYEKIPESYETLVVKHCLKK